MNKGMKVIAQSKENGFYYKGTVVNVPNERHREVQFHNRTKSVVVPSCFVIPMIGARPCPFLRVADYVLVKTGKGPYQCWVPGRVQFTAINEARQAKFYTVIRFNIAVNVQRNSIVKISKSQYKSALRYICHLQGLDLQDHHPIFPEVKKKVRKGKNKHEKEKEENSRKGKNSGENLDKDHGQPKKNDDEDDGTKRDSNFSTGDDTPDMVDSTLSGESNPNSGHIKTQEDLREIRQELKKIDKKLEEVHKGCDRQHVQLRDKQSELQDKQQQLIDKQQELFTKRVQTHEQRTQSEAAHPSMKEDEKKSVSSRKSRSCSSTDQNASCARSSSSHSKPSERSHSSKLSAKSRYHLSSERSKNSPRLRSPSSDHDQTQNNDDEDDCAKSDGNKHRKLANDGVSITGENQKLLQELQGQLNRQQSDLREELKKTVQKLEEVHKGYESQHLQLQDKHSELQGKQQELTDKQQDLRKELKTTVKKLKDVHKSYDSQHAQLQGKHSELQNKQEELIDKQQELFTKRVPTHEQSTQLEGANPSRKEDENENKEVEESNKEEGKDRGKMKEGDEVLARWSVDGWFYRGTIENVAEGGQYFISDNVGSIGKTSEKYIITNKENSDRPIKSGNCVVARHPDYPFRYAPAHVRGLFPDLSCQVLFYDDEKAKVPREEIYKIDTELYDELVEYIMNREKSWVGSAVVARNDDDGMYHRASIKEKVGVTSKFYLKWADGQVSSQFTKHIFGTFKRRQTPVLQDHVLAVVNAASSIYLPGKVVGTNDGYIIVKFCNGRKSSQLDPQQCFWLSKDYYDDAVQFFENIKSKKCCNCPCCIIS